MERTPQTIAEELERHETQKAGHSPERIGQVLIDAAEKNRTPAAEVKIEKNVDTMSRSELLELSSSIMLEASSLRQVYETHLIGEKGLRRLIKLYAEGGNVHEALRKEIAEHELDFERDPQLRDRAFHGGLKQSSSVTLDDLLAKTEAGIELSASDVVLLKARTAEAEQFQAVQQVKVRKYIDIAFSAVIFVLLIIILVLLLGR